MRVRSVTYTRQRKKKHYRRAKGAYATKKNRWRMVKQHLRKVGVYSYIERKDRKSDFRSLWIVRINAALRAKGVRYSSFIKALEVKKIALNRKVLSELAIHEPAAFEAVMKEAGVL
jgi:large subunit ribosomal protein L20